MSFRDIGAILNKAMEEKKQRASRKGVPLNTSLQTIFRRQISSTSSYRIKHTGARSSEVLCRVLESNATS